MVVAKGWQVRGMGKCWSKSMNFQLYDEYILIMYKMVTIVNNIVLFT